MPKSCCAYNCTNRFVKGSGIHYFRFPTDICLKVKWVIAIQRKNWWPSQFSVLCSEHFSEDQLYQVNTHVRPRSEAVPSIFKREKKKKNRKKHSKKTLKSENKVSKNTFLERNETSSLDLPVSSENNDKDKTTKKCKPRKRRKILDTGSQKFASYKALLESVTDQNEVDNDENPEESAIDWEEEGTTLLEDFVPFDYSVFDSLPLDSEDVLKQKLKTLIATTKMLQDKIKLYQRKHDMSLKEVGILKGAAENLRLLNSLGENDATTECISSDATIQRTSENVPLDNECTTINFPRKPTRIVSSVDSFDYRFKFELCAISNIYADDFLNFDYSIFNTLPQESKEIVRKYLKILVAATELLQEKVKLHYDKYQKSVKEMNNLNDIIEDLRLRNAASEM